MYPEYLQNSDTQDMVRRVSELALSDEPALRAHCQEVSRQTDTSSLCVDKDCIAQVNAANRELAIIGKSLQELSQLLSQSAGVFRTQDGKGDFPTVCSAVQEIESARRRLLLSVGELSKLRQSLFESVAKANEGLHFISIAARTVREDLRSPYREAEEQLAATYERMVELDCTIRESQAFYMAMVERHLPSFMRELRAAADFNHAGEALDRYAVRALCGELLRLLGRTPNVSF